MTDQPRWVRLRYVPPPGTHTPVFHLERYWHAGTEFAVPASNLVEIDDVPGFTVLGDAEAPRAPRRG